MTILIGKIFTIKLHKDWIPAFAGMTIRDNSCHPKLGLGSREALIFWNDKGKKVVLDENFKLPESNKKMLKNKNIKRLRSIL